MNATSEKDRLYLLVLLFGEFKNEVHVPFSSLAYEDIKDFVDVFWLDVNKSFASGHLFRNSIYLLCLGVKAKIFCLEVLK